MKKTISLCLLVLSLALAGPAVAAPPSTCASYNPQTCQVVAPSSNGNTNANGSPSGSANATGAVTQAANTGATATLRSSSTLPFTGLDAALLAVGGVVLLAAGVIVRRLTATQR